MQPFSRVLVRAGLLLVALVLGACATSPPRPPVVLVHGAWMGAWAWNRVAEDLRARGHAVIVVELDTAHSPMLAEPKALAAVLSDLAR